MRGVSVLGFLFLLLPLAALGHDGYMAYTHPELGDPLHAFHFSDLGWIWLTYSHDTFDMAKGMIDPALWTGFIDPLLSQRTVVVAAMPLAILLVCVFVRKTLGRLELMRATGKSGGFDYDKSNKKAGRVKYKRH